jgi:hypothetical protein
MSPTEQAARIRELCQLSVFAEKMHLVNEFSNKVIDAVQDALRIADILPEMGLIKQVYANSTAGCKLRELFAHCLVFGVRTHYEKYDTAGGFVVLGQEVMTDFSKILCLYSWKTC